MQLPPYPLMAVVVSQDPDNYALNVSLKGFLGGQMPALPVKVLTHGARDAVRGQYPELPVPGTWGIVVFPSGDPRSGHWLGATDPALNDANALAPQMTGIAYGAHYGGGWSWRGPDGTLFEALPDGTTILAGSAAPQTPTRHTVDQNGVRQRTAFTAAQRATQAPSAFQVVITHPSGAVASLNASGGWTLTAANGQSLALVVSGGVTLTMSGTTVVVSGSITATGNITAGQGGGDQVTLQQHVHGTGSPAAGTAVPTPGH